MIRSGPFNRLTRSSPLIIASLLLLLNALPAAASTPSCLQDVYGSKKLNCTAGDVTVSFADNIRGLDGKSLSSCNPGSTFSFIADFHVITTATSRENVGIYFQTAGASNALKGTCSDNIVGDLHACPNGPSVTCGSPTYHEADPAPDNCGDTTSAHPEVITIEVDDVKCQAAAGTNPPQVALPFCTSWQQNTAIQCVSPTSDYPWVPAAIPGTVSKCDCNNGFTVPIAVQSPGMTLKKSADTSKLGTEGGTVTYTVEVDNNSNFGNITVNQICDSYYGQIAAVAGQPACNPAGAGGTTPVSCNLPATIVAGSNFKCTFTANIGENSDVTDIATAFAVDATGNNPFSASSNSVEVIVGDEPSTAETTKGYFATKSLCATVRYSVDVHNTSPADETISLSKLTDSPYGDVTKLSTGTFPVLGTTCGIGTASNGLGTLNGSKGAGVFGAITPDGHYTCQFDAQFCSAPDGNGCIQQADTMTPTLTGDEGETVSNTGGSLTVKECFTASTP
jgi:hypothetical protein